MKRVAIIGGGASGLFCALLCAKEGWHVELFEQNDKCAKKILVSGNGRCNISNKNLSTQNYYGTNPEFAAHAIKNFGFEAFERFAASLGLLLEVKEDGRAYPLSNEAKSVAALLLAHAKNLGVDIRTETKIAHAKELLEKYDALVIATGSEAASHLGGCGDGYAFAQEFGHTIIPTYPSLVQLHLNSKIAHKMSGAKLECEVTLLRNHAKERTCQGDILFTAYGISGFAVLDISRDASIALQNFEHVLLSLNLLPRFNRQHLAEHIQSVAKKAPDLSIFEMLQGLLPTKIALHFLEAHAIEVHATLRTLDTKLAKKIASLLQDWRFKVSDTHGFRHAEVSGGGVNTDEVDPKTYESKKQKNLYFCGEVLDIVGERGGYNFAFAWASAYAAAKAITARS